MENGSIDFASLLCSRLCHDLLNPVGAITNGLELLAEEHDDAMRAQCLDLLAESARVSAAKLKFYRLAFGSAGGFGDHVPAPEIRAAVEGMFSASGRVAIEWMLGEEMVAKLPAKVLLNLALIAGEALPRGGTLTLGLESSGGAIDVAVRSEGPRLILDSELRKALRGEAGADISSRTVAAVMVRELVKARGGEFMVSDPDQPFLMFGAHLPA